MRKKFITSLVMMVVYTIAALTTLAQNWERGVSFFNQKQYQVAIREFQGVLRTNPEAWQSWYYIGASHFQLQNYVDALDAFQNYIKRGDKDDKAQAAGNYFIGMSHYHLKQYDKAIPALARYIALSEKTQQRVEPSARAALGRTYIFTDRFSEAIPVLTAAAAEMKTNASNYYYIGFAQRKLGRADQAITALNQSLAIDPKDADSLTLLADITRTQPEQNAQTKPIEVESGKAPPKPIAPEGVTAPASQPIRADSVITERRVALVIGNANYKDAPLRNPVNDARALARALRESGFAVSEFENLTKRQMEEQIRLFGKSLRGGIGLFYFAGHGAQINGQNYLIPVGHSIEKEQDVSYEAVDAGRVLGEMEAAENLLNIVILDACRNNPFARGFRSETRGLAVMTAPSGTIVAYSTGPGSVASDGEAENGLYTEELVRNIQQPGLRIEDVFKRIRVAVRTRSKGKQIPWETSALEGDFYFVRN